MPETSRRMDQADKLVQGDATYGTEPRSTSFLSISTEGLYAISNLSSSLLISAITCALFSLSGTRIVVLYEPETGR